MGVHFSSDSNEWQTPPWLFKEYDDLFHFELDAAATKENTLCTRYFTKEDDALIQDWKPYRTVWLNSPYGRLIGKFIKKAFLESQKGCVVCCLMPARTDTTWFFNYCTRAAHIHFIKGRLKFINKTLPSYKEDESFKVSPAPFPSCIVIFDPNSTKPDIIWRTQKS